MRNLVIVCTALLLSGVAAPAHAQSEGRLLHASLVGFMSAEGADLSTTMYAIGANKGTEANPVFAPFTKTPVAAGMFKMGMATLFAGALVRYHQNHPKLVFFVANAGAVFYTAIAVHNSRIAR